MKVKLSVKNHSNSFFLYLAVLIVLSFLFIFFFILIDRNGTIDYLKTESAIQVEYQKNLLHDHLSTIKSDLLFLPQLNEQLSYREMSNEEDLRLIEKEFLEFSKQKGDYDQIRYINEDGYEIIRINNNEGNPVIVPQYELQNKKERYYFSETAKLKEGDIYFSPFDLNMERGELEQPLKPMIRIGTPVFNRSGEHKGIIIFNYLGNHLLEHLTTATDTKPGVFSLLNKDGYWLYNEDKDLEWGFMYPQRQDRNLPTTNPEKWQEINKISSQQIVTKTGLWTSDIISLLDPINSTSDEYWILENTINFEDMGITWPQYFFRVRYVCLFVFIFDLLVAYILFFIISQRNRLQNEMKSLALYDTLTRLPNRRLLYERAETALTQSRRYGYSIAFLFIDLDGFKAVNDTWGHEGGDQLLSMVADRLKECVRTSDTVSRVGGDEFIILISQIKDKKNCPVVANKILKNLSQDYILTKGKANIQGSIGVALSNPESEETVEELIHNADTAMYDVKNSGKNSYKVFEKDS